MGEHTPGPWFVAEGGVCATECPEDGANVVCLEPERVMRASLARWPANARLVAAAPELLDAARKALNYIANTEGELGISLESGDALRAAIAKAKGL